MDLNGDGFIDIIAGGVTDPATQKTGVGVFLSNGDGTFKPGVVYDMPAGSTQTFIVDDYNGDGSFSEGIAYDSVPEGTAIAATDIDGDGNLDLVVARASNGSFGAAGLGNQTTANTWCNQVLMGRGDGRFVGAAVTLAGQAGVEISGNSAGLYSANSYALADFHQSGHVDLLAKTNGTSVGPGPKSLTIVPGVGDGSFTGSVVSPTNIIPSIVAAADLNKDGQADAVVAGDNGSGTVMLGVLFGKGDGTLSGEQDHPLPGAGSAVQIADFNGDGIPDIAVAVNCSAPCAPGVYVAYGQSTQTYSTPALLSGSPAASDGGSQMYLASGDLNGDGIADLVVANGGFLSGNGLTMPGVIHVYLGKSNSSFTAITPAVPALYVTDVALADLSKDGKLDIVLGADDQNGNTQVVLLCHKGWVNFGAAQHGHRSNCLVMPLASR